MQVRPTFRRFGVVVGLVLAAGCSSIAGEGDAANAPTTTVASTAAETSTSTFPTVAPTTTAPPVENAGAATLDDLRELPGTIVYRDAAGDIAVVDPDGEDQRVVSGDGAAHAQPTWSSRGDRIAWTSFGPEGPLVNVVDIATLKAKTVRAPTPAFYYSWSPDDSWLAALGPNGSGVELFIANGDDLDVRRIATGQPFFIDWVSDAELVAAVNAQAIADIPADPDTTPSQRVLNRALGLFQAPAAIDADHTLIALEATSGNDIVAVDAEGSEWILATTSGAVSMSPNPADDRVAVLVTRTQAQSQVISAQTDPPPQLPVDMVSIVSPSDAATAVHTIDVEAPLAAMWSPTGETLAILSARATEWEWVFFRDGTVSPGQRFMPTREFATSYVPFADQYGRSSSWWSPDGQAFVFAGSVGEDVGVWVDVVDDGRGAVQVAVGDIAFWSPQ